MRVDWRNDDPLRRAQGKEEELRSEIDALNKELQTVLPNAPPHPHLLHSREEWEELTRKPSPATNALLRMLREAQAPTKPAPYTIDFPNTHLRMRTTTDPDALLRIVQDIEIIDGPTAKPVEWGPGYCYTQGEG